VARTGQVRSAGIGFRCVGRDYGSPIVGAFEPHDNAERVFMQPGDEVTDDVHFCWEPKHCIRISRHLIGERPGRVLVLEFTEPDDENGVSRCFVRRELTTHEIARIADGNLAAHGVTEVGPAP
jgi:hypothetical protein